MSAPFRSQPAQEKNPFEMTVEEQINALRLANKQEQWGFMEADFARLIETAPEWPQGKHIYRSFRIRFGEEIEGVLKTFEAHFTRIKHVFGEGHYRRLQKPHSPDTLRLLNGNHTHRPILEWVIINLDMHKEREDITAVRNSRSLADELLVIAWMFPDMIRALNDKDRPGLYAAGYEFNSLGYFDDEEEPWHFVIIVRFVRDRHQIYIDQNSSNPLGYSIPEIQE